MSGFSSGFGLPYVAASRRQEHRVFNADCYICIDPEVQLCGLPMCRACPKCSGHIAADHCVCDDCGYDEDAGKNRYPRHRSRGLHTKFGGPGVSRVNWASFS